MKSLSPHDRLPHAPVKNEPAASLQPCKRSTRALNGSNSSLLCFGVVLACTTLLPCLGFSQGGPPASPSAADLLRKTVDAELKAQDTDHSRWMYELKTHAPQKI